MHTASYEFLMKPKESARCHQTLSARVGSGDETTVLAAHPLPFSMRARREPGNKAISVWAGHKDKHVFCLASSIK